jgi:hypothetical protein
MVVTRRSLNKTIGIVTMNDIGGWQQRLAVVHYLHGFLEMHFTVSSERTHPQKFLKQFSLSELTHFVDGRNVPFLYVGNTNDALSNPQQTQSYFLY